MPNSGDPAKKGSLGRQASITSLEQSLNMVNLPPARAPVTIYPGPAAQHANMAKVDTPCYTSLYCPFHCICVQLTLLHYYFCF